MWLCDLWVWVWLRAGIFLLGHTAVLSYCHHQYCSIVTWVFLLLWSLEQKRWCVLTSLCAPTSLWVLLFSCMWECDCGFLECVWSWVGHMEGRKLRGIALQGYFLAATTAFDNFVLFGSSSRVISRPFEEVLLINDVIGFSPINLMSGWIRRDYEVRLYRFWVVNSSLLTIEVSIANFSLEVVLAEGSDFNFLGKWEELKRNPLFHLVLFEWKYYNPSWFEGYRYISSCAGCCAVQLRTN